MSELIGKRISHYRIAEQIGQGGMGVIYKAQDSKLHRTVALKFLTTSLTQDEDSKQRFMVEARAASGLDHPNIYTIYEINEKPDGQMFICMAYYDGQTLKEKLAHGKLSAKAALEIVTQIAKGLQRAHQEGIVHRDIKPANIIITDRGEVKIVDFGLAKLAGQPITRTGGTLGTLFYMSPEQIQNQPVDGRTDIWALGCVLYQMLSGELPFQGEFDPAILYAILNLDPKPLNQLCPGVPPTLVRIIEKALQKDVDKRYQSMGEMLADLRSLSATNQPRQSFFKSSLRLTAIFALLLALLSVGIYWGMSQRKFDITQQKTEAKINPSRIAVFPFRFQGNSDFHYLREGVSQLLSMNLDGIGDLRSLDPNMLRKAISRDSLMEFDRETGQEMANRFGAGRYILGNITAMNEQVRIDARLFASTPGSDPVNTAFAVGKSEYLFKLIDQLTTQLIGAMAGQEVSQFAGFAFNTTNSFAALKDFLSGEELFRHGRLDEAISTFKMAVQKDSTFALAHYRLAVVSGFVNYRPVNRLKALHAAGRHQEKLSYRHQLLLKAKTEEVNGNSMKAESLYRNVVSIYPDEVEAWRALGFHAFHFAGRLGRPLTEGIEAFKSALYYDPEDLPSLGVLTTFARHNENRTLSDSLSKRLIELMPNSPRNFQNRTQLAFPGGDITTKIQILEDANRMQPFELRGAVQALGRFTDAYQPALQLCRILTESETNAYYRNQGYNLLAHLLLSRGQVQEAKRELDVLATFEQWDALKFKTILFLTPLTQTTETELIATRRQLNTAKNAKPVYRYYLVGLISVHLKEFSTALENADKLEEYSRKTSSNKRAGFMAADYAKSIRAAIAHKQGNFEKALGLLDASQPERWWVPVARDVIAAMSYEHHLRAELYRELGKLDEALRWYRALGYGGHWSFLYLPISHLRQGEIYQEMGDNPNALRHYRRFIDFWQNCDPELQVQVEEARQKISALQKLTRL